MMKISRANHGKIRVIISSFDFVVCCVFEVCDQFTLRHSEI